MTSILNLFDKKDFINAKWFVAEKIVQLIAALIIIPKIFNELGTVDIGKLELSKSLIGFLVPILMLGLSSICIRELIFTPEKKHKILASALFLRLISCFFILLGLFIYAYYTNDSEISTIILILGLGYFFKITDVLEYYIQALKLSKIIFICKVSSLIIIVSAQYYGIQQHYSVYYFASLFAIDFLIQGLVYSFFLFGNKKLSLTQWKFNFKMSQHLIKLSYPLIISNLIIAFYIGIDELFLKYYIGDMAVGVFATVQFLVIWLTWNIGASFIYALYPAYAEAYNTDKTLYKKRIGLSYKIVIIFGIFIALFFTFLGDFIYNTFYSESFYVGKLPLKIFCWAPLFVFIGVIYEKHLININELYKNIYRFLLGCLINLILCYFLIPKYEIIGAAYSVLISHIFTNLGFILFDKKSRIFFIQAIRS
jgi:O-antigen/teichoic acid export membrane protein